MSELERGIRERPRLPNVGSLRMPTEVLEAPGVHEAIVRLGTLAIGRTSHQPGWRWSTHIKPLVGTQRCQVRHVGVVLSGRLGIELADGTRIDLGPDDAFDLPPGHDAWTIGDEPLVMLGWTGVQEWLVPADGERLLAALLFTDIVGSTARLREVGDRAWRALMTAHDEAVREVLAGARGREVNTTGDGFLAMFDAPARALQAALAVHDRTRALGLELRAGVHVGEIELTGTDVRGLAVHETARIMDAAQPGEVLASAVTRALVRSPGIRFVSRGVRALKGLRDEYELFAVESVPT